MALTQLLLELMRDLLSADEPTRSRAADEARELLPAVEAEAARFRATESTPDADWAEDPYVWEHQGRPLTVGDLRVVWGQVRADLPVVVAVYEPSGVQRSFTPIEIGLSGRGLRPDALVVTVAEIERGGRGLS